MAQQVVAAVVVVVDMDMDMGGLLLRKVNVTVTSVFVLDSVAVNFVKCVALVMMIR
jgi:hypothetical protein